MDEKKQFIDAVWHLKYNEAKKISNLYPNLIEQIQTEEKYSFELSEKLANRIHHDPQKIVKFIKKLNINIDIKDGNGFTLLMLASIKQDLYVVKLLLDNNANINEVNNRGHTALFIALIYHSSNSAIYLLEQENIDINIKDVKGQTIFDFLSEKEDKKHCKAIIKLYEKKLNEHQKYYENLLEKKLKKQKEELYEEIYAPSGIGYEAAKNRFENKN